MKLNKAFSLAEILLVLAIIGIVMVMGLSISRHNAEQAFSLYYYTGYVGLSDAINEVVKNGNNISASIDDMNKFNDEIAKVFNTTYDSTKKTITATNGIVYKYRDCTEHEVKKVNTNGKANDMSGEKKFVAKYSMSVPQIDGKDRYAYIAYIQDWNGGLILPYQTKPSTDDVDIDLTSRVDLLPFYKNDGLNRFEDGKSEIVFKSYNEIFCDTYGNFEITDVFKPKGCAISAKDNSTGVIVPANPRKVW